MFHQYLQSIGLERLINDAEVQALNSIVVDASEIQKTDYSDQDIHNLYTYKVPKLGEGGACSITDELEETPYNLAQTYKIDYNVESLKTAPQTLRLQKLNAVIEKLQNITGVDWLGIYRRTQSLQGEEILLKEAYYGAPSRAEFPLNETFAKTSNNSTVGLSGKAVVVNSVDDYDGPYYECDSKVQSEFCLPIFNSNNEVIGIIDAEAFAKNFFDEQKLLEISKVCFDLGDNNLFLNS